MSVGSVGVVGLGLIGGSLARALDAADVDVVATDPSAQARAAAREVGLEVVGDVRGVCARRPDLVVLAAPLRAMRAVAVQVAGAVASDPGWDPTVTDVGSVKGPVRDAVRDAGLAARYVGAHPMAGTENSGFDASFPDLLRGIRWVVTVPPGTDGASTDGASATDSASGIGGAPARGADAAGSGAPGAVREIGAPDRLASVLALITRSLGGTVTVLTDEMHDEVVALVSHVPHVLAGELLGLVAGARVQGVALGLAAGSFRDGTRVAYGDPRRAEAMVTQNAAWVAPALRVAARDLEQLADTLDSNGPAGWFFDRPEALRARPGGHGRDANSVGQSRQTGAPRRAGQNADSAAEPHADQATGPPAQQRIPLSGDWPTDLLECCAAGAVVVTVTPDSIILT